jgi:leucyl aminopeptidase
MGWLFWAVHSVACMGWPFRTVLAARFDSRAFAQVADFNNIGGRAGGTITAGLFLKQFVDAKKMEWVHLDIAGPAFDQVGKLGTGFGATTLAHWVEDLAKSD